MGQNYIAKSSISVDAPREKVWAALVDPKAIKQYMFGADVKSDWRKGGKITFEGEYQGKKYKDKGEILDVEPGRTLKYSHFSPLSGEPDKPENYHVVNIELSEDGNKTLVKLTQDKNRDEKAREHSEQNWDTALSGLKKYIEQ